MAFKYTKHFLKKLENLFTAIEYTIRYEKGNFQSGYCVVENRKIAVVNKFFDTEARINTLLDILSTFDLEPEHLEEPHLSLYKELLKSDYLTPTEDTEPSN